MAEISVNEKSDTSSAHSRQGIDLYNTLYLRQLPGENRLGRGICLKPGIQRTEIRVPCPRNRKRLYKSHTIVEAPILTIQPCKSSIAMQSETVISDIQDKSDYAVEHIDHVPEAGTSQAPLETKFASRPCSILA